MCVNTVVSCNWVLFAMPWQAFAGDEGRFDPESTNAFSGMHDCTAEMVLLTMMPSGKNHALVSKLAMTSLGLSASVQRRSTSVLYCRVEYSGQTGQVMQKIGDHFCCFLSCHLGSCFNVNVEFPMWVNSKSAVKGIIKILKHIKQVVLLRFAKVGKLFDNIVHVQLFILGIQVGRGKAVWIVPVSAKGLFLPAVYFKGFDHSEIGSHMGNSRLNHSMVPEH